MFNGCAKLNHLKVMFNDWGYDTACGWTQGVMDNGTFVCPSILEDKRGNDYIPTNWQKENV